MSSEEDRATARKTHVQKILWSLEMWSIRYASALTDRQTQTQTRWSQYFAPYQGRSNKVQCECCYTCMRGTSMFQCYRRLQTTPCQSTNQVTVTTVTSGQSNLTKLPHRRRTRTVQSYSPGGANVHPNLTHTSLGPPESIPKRHLDRFSRFGRTMHSATMH